VAEHFYSAARHHDLIGSEAPVRWRKAVLAGALATGVVLYAGPVAASTGSPPTWSNWLHWATSIYVARSLGLVGYRTYRLEVGPVLLGTAPELVTYRAVDTEPRMPAGSRWVIMTVTGDKSHPFDPTRLNGRWEMAQSVDSAGHIDWGRIIEAPPTVPALLTSFGLPATDSATVSGQQDAQWPVLPLGLGVIAGALALVARRRWRPPLLGPPA